MRGLDLVNHRIQTMVAIGIDLAQHIAIRGDKLAIRTPGINADGIEAVGHFTPVLTQPPQDMVVDERIVPHHALHGLARAVG